ncbi:MAG: glutathione S-transferase family protein [Pseudomonadales bacterium]|nr:glutathione S-transferase family protein [Pseudomonadales bacterium]
MKLYETSTAPNPRRVRMFLAEKGLLNQVETVQVDLQKGENLTPEFAAMNPLKKVPVLVLDDGSSIAETMAICRYFEELYPDDTPLLGRSPREKAHVEQWLRWIEYYLFVPTGMCFQHSTGYFKDRMTPIKEWGEECGRNVATFFRFLDTHLKNNEYICGDQFTAADINVFVSIQFNRVNDIRIQDDQLALQAWYERMKQRASTKV